MCGLPSLWPITHSTPPKAPGGAGICPCGFARVTKLDLLRLLTTSAAMGGHPLTNAEAWRVYDLLLEDERVWIFPEPPDSEDLFRSLSALGQPPSKLWVDASAHASANAATWVNFDQAFERYRFLWRILTRSEPTTSGAGSAQSHVPHLQGIRWR
jgi:predicted nucleic acid-binding protein